MHFQHLWEAFSQNIYNRFIVLQQNKKNRENMTKSVDINTVNCWGGEKLNKERADRTRAVELQHKKCYETIEVYDKAFF